MEADAGQRVIEPTRGVTGHPRLLRLPRDPGGSR
jgi:hypothetical protein